MKPCRRRESYAARLVALLLVCSSLGCTGSFSRLAKAPVMEVNQHSLNTSQFSAKLARALRSHDALTAKDPVVVKAAKEKILQDFLLQSLVQDYAATVNLAVSDQEVDVAANAVRAGYPDDIAFRKTLAEEEISLIEWREQLRLALLSEKLFLSLRSNIKPASEVELRQAFESQKERFRRNERIYLRQIVVDEYGKADTLSKELRRRDFSELAKKYSLAPESKSGGLVGWIEKGEVDIFDKAFSLKPGANSEPLESPYGFHIFRVERKSPAGFASFDEVREDLKRGIESKREQAEFSAWLDKQLRSAKVLRDNALMNSISVETRGRK